MIASPSRTAKRDPGQAQVTPRDLMALRLMGRAGPITAEQAAKYCRMSAASARHRLRKLRDLGHVAVHVVAMEAPSRYRLTARGKAEVVRAFGLDPSVLVAPEEGGDGPFLHRDLVTDLYIALACACAASTGLALVDFRFERDIRAARAGATAHMLVPDAVAVVERRLDGSRVAFAVEADAETETPRYVRDTKAVPYGLARSRGTPLLGYPDWRVLCVVPRERRARKLASAIWEAAEVPEGLWYYGVGGELVPEQVLVRGWRTPRFVGDQAALCEESPFVVARGARP